MRRILLFVGMTASGWGQVASSVLLGDVRDETSAVVPGAEIVATHEATGFSRSTTSNSTGSYRLEELMPGVYSVAVQKAGFRQVRIQDVRLEVNQKAELAILLQIGPTTQSVTVQGDLPTVQSSDATVGYRLDSPMFSQLPLDRRDVIPLVTLGPGAIPRQLGGFVHDSITDVQESRGAVALNPPVNGARSTMNFFTLDGASNTDRNTFAIAVNPPMEAVQEFRIQSSLPSAEFAQAGGGVVDLVTRSGSREWHGSAFDYSRNEATDARNYFDDPALPRPISRRQQFGGSLSGPALFPRTFFFATYEGLRGKSAKSSLNLVPTQAVRQGDFDGAATIFDPLNVDRATGRRAPFANNRIPDDRISPIAREFLQTYEPLPNRTGASGNYLDATPSEDQNDSASGRIDHGFREGRRLSARYSINDERGRVADAFPVRPFLTTVRAQQAAVGYTSAGSSWLNQARASLTRLRVFNIPESAFQTDVAHELGITGLPSDPFSFGLPFFLITSVSTVTDSPTLPQTQRDNSWNFSDGVSFNRGRHTWKLGGDWGRFQLNYMQTQFVRGRYTFTGAFAGDPVADFLLGFPQITNRTLGSTQAYLRQNSFAGYLQDDWRMNDRLSLNFGLRYEYVSPFREERGNLLNVDYSGLPAPPRLVPVDSPVSPDRNNWAPRIGLALRPMDRHGLVFRAGYGLYFSPEIATETYDLIRNGVRNEQNTTEGSQPPLLTLANGFPTTASTGLPGYFGLDPLARTPYVQQWSAGFQEMLPARTVIELAYVGTKGTRLGRFRRFNTPLQGTNGEYLDPRPGDLQQLRPFPELGVIIQRENLSNSIYHSLQIKVEKRMSQRFTLLASLVWAKSIDDSDSAVPGGYGSVGAQDERNLRLERALSFFDVRRRVSAAFVWNLPGESVSQRLLSNWQLSGVVTLQDGTPVNPAYFAYDGANVGTPNRPDVVPGQKITLPRSQRTADHFFNTDAFRTPSPYTFGNAGRNIIPGPGNNLFELALHRRFMLGESRSLQVRAEFFNAFNHPNWGIPGTYPDFGPFFGKIFATGDPRRIQLALRYDF
jgi:hypothetical protein